MLLMQCWALLPSLFFYYKDNDRCAQEMVNYLFSLKDCECSWFSWHTIDFRKRRVYVILANHFNCILLCKFLLIVEYAISLHVCTSFYGPLNSSTFFSFLWLNCVLHVSAVAFVV